MRSHGYYFCDACEELASGPRCERHNDHAVRWVDVARHQNPFRRAGGLRAPQPVSPERARELFRQMRRELNLHGARTI